MSMNLRIRRMTEQDLEPLYRLLSDPEVMRFLEPPYTREQVSEFHQMSLSENPLVYAAEAGGTFIGYVIYHPYEEDSMEIGWVLLPEYWRHGYASGLTMQMIEKAAGAGKTAVIECDPLQEVTKHIAQKFGFTPAGSRDGLDVYKRNITIKKTETDDEIKGKAYVHWHAWHEAYPGMVSQNYLDRFTLEKAEKMAFSWGGDHLIIAKAGDRVIGFVGYGDRGEEAPETGEIFALYVLSEYYGTGVGKQLMNAGLEQLKGYPQICLWVLKENKRAIHFYEKCGFHPDGQEMYSKNVEAPEIRMVKESSKQRGYAEVLRNTDQYKDAMV